METDYHVSGMTCDHCVRSVTESLTALAGVRSVSVDLSTGLVRVRSDEPLAQSKVSEAIAEAGYQLAS